MLHRDLFPKRLLEQSGSLVPRKIILLTTTRTSHLNSTLSVLTNNHGREEKRDFVNLTWIVLLLASIILYFLKGFLSSLTAL